MLEYIEGETLSELLRRESGLEQVRLRRLLEELLSGLEEVHSAGFVHRDVKPGNIMLRTDGTAVLLDFGAARQAVGQRSKSITSILTPGYAPIEQYAQKMDNVGPWSDLYALGMVAYRCISGLGDGGLPDAVSRALMRKGGEDKDLTLASVAGKGRYDQPLLEAIDWAIKVEEGERPQDVSALRRALVGSRKQAAVSKVAAGRPDSEMNRPERKWALPLLPLCLAASLAAIASGGWWMLIGEEWSYWRGVGCTEETALQAYRERYPAGRYEGKAQVCLTAIKRKQKQEEAGRLTAEVERARLAEEKRKDEERKRLAAAYHPTIQDRLAADEERKRTAEVELARLAEERRKAESEAKRKQAEAASRSKLEAERSRFVQVAGRETSANFTDANGWTDLHYAAALNLTSLAKRLLESGAKVDARLKSDGEPFTDELKATLRRFGKDYDGWNRHGYTPLYIAAAANAVATATLLVERGAAVNAKNNNGETPLHFAASNNAVETATLLFERGAAVNAKDDNGWTPLHSAAWNNAVGTATLLIERGAAVNAKSNYGETPLAVALRFDAYEAVAVIRQHGGRK